jgi:hypothetical protein
MICFDIRFLVRLAFVISVVYAIYHFVGAVSLTVQYLHWKREMGAEP